MKKTALVLIALFCGGVGPWCAVAYAADPSAEPEGVVSLTPVGAGSCVAVRFHLPKDQALAGVRWYNNDGSASPERLLLAEAEVGADPRREEAVAVGQGPTGLSSQWSELYLDNPVASAAAAIDVFFEIAQNSALIGRGAGGGTAFGYRTEEGGPAAFISNDGQAWARLRPDCRVLVEPILVAREASTPVIGAAAPKAARTGESHLTTALLTPRPNPANPEVVIAFSLGREEIVDLAIFDLRGRRIADLLHGPLPAGAHEISWGGRDMRGRQVSSGAYFARLKAGDALFSRRLLVVR